jgi:hypothetical protein
MTDPIEEEEDPIVAEVRRVRDEIAASHGYDLRRIFEDARRRQHLSGHPVVSFIPEDKVEPFYEMREEPPKP